MKEVQARAEAKQRLVAAIHAVANELEHAAGRVRIYARAQGENEIDEWEMVQHVIDEVFTLPGQLDLVAVCTRLVEFQVHDLKTRGILKPHLDALSG